MDKNKNSDSKYLASFILPVEIEVTQEPGIYSPLKSIDFGTISLKNTSSEGRLQFYSSSVFKDQLTGNKELIYFSAKRNSSVKVVDLYLTNYSPNRLKITVFLLLFR